MTQMPSGPFLYDMYLVWGWGVETTDIKGKIWREKKIVFLIFFRRLRKYQMHMEKISCPKYKNFYYMVHGD